MRERGPFHAFHLDVQSMKASGLGRLRPLRLPSGSGELPVGRTSLVRRTTFSFIAGFCDPVCRPRLENIQDSFWLHPLLNAGPSHKWISVGKQRRSQGINLVKHMLGHLRRCCGSRSLFRAPTPPPRPPPPPSTGAKRGSSLNPQAHVRENEPRRDWASQ